ncbi:MAG: DUF3846 domain-containing protein [Clostridia bacterium]|nr:DUF3846 domain-containing protein [Clostridia bacterium]
MKVVLVKAGEKAVPAEIGSTLKDMQDVVGGYIESLYPFEEEVAIICNDEGKLNGLPLNRALYDEDGKIIDIIAGDFFVCGLTEDNFGDLSPEQIRKYTDLFLYPEAFFRSNGGIVAVKVVG